MSDAFHAVGRLGELTPGEGKMVTVNGRDVALFRLGADVFALDNTCLHRGGPLCEGMIEDDIVTCPWHGWSYQIRTGTMVQDPSVGVAAHEVRIDDDVVSVRLID